MTPSLGMGHYDGEQEKTIQRAIQWPQRITDKEVPIKRTGEQNQVPIKRTPILNNTIITTRLEL